MTTRQCEGRHLRKKMGYGEAPHEVTGSRAETSKRGRYAVVDVDESMWILDDDDGANGGEERGIATARSAKTLMITLVKPPLTQDEIMWKKGKQTLQSSHVPTVSGTCNATVTFRV